MSRVKSGRSGDSLGWRKAAQSFKLSDGVEETVIASSQDFVGVGLMADIPNEFIFRGIENFMKGNCQFDRTQDWRLNGRH